MKPIFLFFGFGYTAQTLATHLNQDDFSMVGTTRNMTLATSHPDIHLIDFHTPDMKQYLSKTTHLLISIPPTQSGEDITLNTYGEQIKSLSSQLKWIGYLSSTGVYGDHHGEWVNEDSTCKPTGQSALARLQAEKSWLEFAKTNQLPLHAFRLAGIYGRRRNALSRIVAGKQYSIYKEGHVFSRIHVDDIATVLLASIHAPNPLSIYNVADDNPSGAHEVDAFAAKLLGIPPLPLLNVIEANLSEMEKEFYANNRRVSNAKIKHELNVTLNYPSYREGLMEIWREANANK